MRSRRMPLALERTFCSPRPFGRNFVRTLRRTCILRRFLSRRRRSSRRQFHSCAPRLRKPNGNCLLGRSRSMFALPNVIHLFLDKLSRLRRWRFPFARIFSGPLHGLPLRHGNPLLVVFSLNYFPSFPWAEAVCQSENRCTLRSEAAVSH